MSMPVREIPAGLTAEQAAIVASQQVYAAQQEQLRQYLAMALAAIWAGVALFPELGLPEAQKFVGQILPISLGAQRAMAAVTVAALNSTTRPVTPISIAPDTVSGTALRRRDPAEYYQRPFNEMRYRLSQGRTLGEALDAGRRRAESIVQTDLQLAHTRTAQEYLRRQGELPPDRAGRQIVGYQRVLSNRPNHCALCVLASTRRYRIAELMPIHPGCGCTVQAVYGDEDYVDDPVLDPERVQEIDNIIRRDLGDEYADPGGVRGPARYRDIVIVHNHGELGPVLGVRGHHFRGPRDIPNLGHDRVNRVDEESF